MVTSPVDTHFMAGRTWLTWPSLAKEADVEISVDFSEEMRDHPNTAEIEIETRDGNITRVCGASIGGGSILITEINGLEMELSGEYPALIVRHRDVPGVINTVTNILANEHVNVAFMRVFRHARRQDACTLEKAVSSAYKKVEKIHFDNAFYRRDIGAKALAATEEK